MQLPFPWSRVILTTFFFFHTGRAHGGIYCTVKLDVGGKANVSVVNSSYTPSFVAYDPKFKCIRLMGMQCA
jgi:hypothetical protein